MSERMDMIIMLIKEEARDRAGFKDYSGKLYDVKLDVDIQVGKILIALLQEERERAKKKGGP